MVSAYIPHVTQIKELAFNSCRSLKSIDFPEVTSVGESAFYDCTSLTTASMPRIESISSELFYDAELLVYVDFPEVETLSTQTSSHFSPIQNGFKNCRSLVSAKFGKVDSLPDATTFRNCISLYDVSLPKVTSLTKIPNNTFKTCTSLSRLRLPGIRTISSSNNSTLLSIGLKAGCEVVYNGGASTYEVTGNPLKDDQVVYDDDAVITGVSSTCSTNVERKAFKNGIYLPDDYAWGFSNKNGLFDRYAVGVKEFAFYQGTSFIDIWGSDSINYMYQVSSPTFLVLANATFIGRSAFDCCKLISGVVLPKVTSIGENAFSMNSARGFYYDPEESDDGDYVVVQNSVLDFAFLPSITEVSQIGNSAFRGCPLKVFVTSIVPDVLR